VGCANSYSEECFLYGKAEDEFMEPRGRWLQKIWEPLKDVMIFMQNISQDLFLLYKTI
jgi:hypothetical protein